MEPQGTVAGRWHLQIWCYHREIYTCYPVLQSHTSAPTFCNVITPSSPTLSTFTAQLFLDFPFFRCKFLLFVMYFCSLFPSWFFLSGRIAKFLSGQSGLLCRHTSGRQNWRLDKIGDFGVKPIILEYCRCTTYYNTTHWRERWHICVCVYFQTQGPLRECRSIQQGASRLPYYCTPLVCVPDVIGLLAVWQHNKPKTKNQKRSRENEYMRT